jgi:hypothetical protein
MTAAERHAIAMCGISDGLIEIYEFGVHAAC